MQEVLENIIKKFQEVGNIKFSSFSKPLITVEDAIGIVKQEAEEYKNVWIPCSDRLPDSGVTVIVSYKDRFLQNDGTCDGWYDAANMMWHMVDYECSENAEVIAWRKRLEPYQQKGE